MREGSRRQRGAALVQGERGRRGAGLGPSCDGRAETRPGGAHPRLAVRGAALGGAVLSPYRTVSHSAGERKSMARTRRWARFSSRREKGRRLAPRRAARVRLARKRLAFAFAEQQSEKGRRERAFGERGRNGVEDGRATETKVPRMLIFCCCRAAWVWKQWHAERRRRLLRVALRAAVREGPGGDE